MATSVFLGPTRVNATLQLGLDTGGTKNVVVTMAAFTDADATSLGDGSLVCDNTTGSGKVGVVVNGQIQTLALA